MSWTILLGLIGIVGALGLALLLASARRAELRRMEQSVKERDRAHRHGVAQAQLQHPVIDLSRCLGCGTCVAVCPEKGVLELVHGQAVVVNGARCVGIAECERECPVGAITVTLTNLEKRNDVPVLDEKLEAVGKPGLFLAGEITALALIKTAVDQGRLVANEVARRLETRRRTPVEPLQGAPRRAPDPEQVVDLCIVGAGPAGLSCSLEAKRLGLSFVTLENESFLGGTVAKYPRRKLVLTQPIDLPLHGRLASNSYSKEELMELWSSIAREHELPIRGGERFEGVEGDEPDGFVVRTEKSRWHARYVCLALGRRGVPRKLGVRGEELPKVAHGLLDAHAYQGRRILVVGGGDSAVETALGLAEQPGNEVTLSYRKEDFVRIKSRNQERLQQAVAQQALDVVVKSELVAIEPMEVELEIDRDGTLERRRLKNDDVFVMAGGTAPIEMLTQSGVSFDAKLRTPPPRIEEQGTGLLRALAAAFAAALAALVWVLWNHDYYGLPVGARPTHEKHDLLRPGMGAGLAFGIATVALVALNLLYLVRRSTRFRFRLGSLRTWMTSHVATGILALLCALLHGAMAPRETAGGHAFWSLAILVATGAIGRYFYSYVPRAANGRELELAEALQQIAPNEAVGDPAERKFRSRARDEVAALIERRQWKSSFLARVLALLGSQRDLHQTLRKLTREGAVAKIGAGPLRDTLALARRAHRSALIAAHYEDLRAILNSWRFFHRWVAALMVLLVLIHVYCAFFYGSIV
jgi:thioredoxin reductase/Pyruvate/2-oxoacid:ferredoxin oxidoreductase delta subunit